MTEAQIDEVVKLIVERGQKSASGLVLILDELHIRQLIAEVLSA